MTHEELMKELTRILNYLFDNEEPHRKAEKHEGGMKT